MSPDELGALIALASTVTDDEVVTHALSRTAPAPGC